ncbi:NADP-dependent oxidoreductase [Fulvitalea axinellae]
MENKTIILKSRPTGEPTVDNFEFVNEPKPVAGKGEILLKTLYVSVDPYLRGRMSEAKSYIEPFKLGEPVVSGIVAEVLESHNDDFQVGDCVSGMLAWKEFQTSDGKGLHKVDGNAAPLSTYLGILGMTGLTAYLGLTKIGKPKEGETLVVSGAAGAVGTVVGQVGKIMGCQVVGIAGTDEKVEMLKTKFGYDEAINYKTTVNMQEAIAEACPDGVDIYFDNVGGEISDAVIANINRHARIPLCGSISVYNSTEMPVGPRLQVPLLRNSVLMQGFIVFDFAEHYPEALMQLATWLGEGKLTYEETVVEGFDKIPEAFLSLFSGKNKGKMLVKV